MQPHLTAASALSLREARSPIANAIIATGAAVLLAALTAQPVRADSCSDLTGAQLNNAKVLAAVTLSGKITGPDGKDYSGLPSFCSVSVLATPSSDSAINITLWMPTNHWNGRFEGTGNGGYAGNIAIDAPAMVYAIEHDMAVAATDMGTAPSGNSNGDALVGHPEKWIDFGYRATHVMTEHSKTLIRAFYNRGPKYSYFNGCSTGGQQALMSAQRYPADYDGILGGDPASDRTHVHTGVVWNYFQLHKTPTNILTSGQISAITTSMLKACAKKSGGVATDAFLTDPSRCNWSAAALLCSSPLQSNCLSADQVKAVDSIYAGPTDPVTHAQIYPGAPRGSESASSFGWSNQESQTEPEFDSLYKWVFGSQWQYTSFDYHNSQRDVDKVLAKLLNANNPDLSAFRARNGKLIVYQGTADPLVAPGSPIDYFHNVVKAQNNGNYSSRGIASTQQFFRLFMVPGMNHCAGGPGPNAFGNQFSGTIAVTDPPDNHSTYHALSALIRWVENGVAPDHIIATKYVNDLSSQGIAMQRPLCPYPAWPKYNGTGDTTKASSFSCVAR